MESNTMKSLNNLASQIFNFIKKWTQAKRISYALVGPMTAAVLLYPSSAVATGDPEFSKTAHPSSGFAPLSVVYTYKFDNTKGNRGNSVDDPWDDKCSPIVFSGGDSNNNRVLDVGEIWTWTCAAVINATTVNTAYGEVSWTVCGDEFCTKSWLLYSVTSTVTIPPLSVSIDVAGSVCKGGVFTLTATPAAGVPPYTFKWTTGETSQAIVPSTSTAGVYTFGVTVTDSTGATASANKTVTIGIVCLTPVHPPREKPEIPLLTTFEWGCGFSFAGVCLSEKIVKICIGGHCFDNPTSDPRSPKVCPLCGVLMGIAAGAAGALIVGVLLARVRRR